MATPVTTTAAFADTLARSRLVPGAVAARALRQFRADGGRSADVSGFRRFVVAHLGLTEYQAALLQRGRSDGFHLGGYTILDRVGTGATGGVYKAAHRTGQVVAVKVLPRSKADHPQALARFRREGRLLAQLDHPNVVRAFEVGATDRVQYIVMELLGGETLDRVAARRGRLPVGEAVRLARQALAGLHHLHERRVVHRDLKPSNLMAVPGGEPTTLGATLKLFDVGIGRELLEESSDTRPPAADPRLTAVGAVLGSPRYLAPEQARDARSAGPAADQYGLGCVLFHLLAGRPPFPDLGELALLLQHATGAFDPLPDAPPGLQAVFDRLTAKDPADRYPSAAAAAEALAPFEPPGAVPPAAATVLPAYRDFLTRNDRTDLELVADPLPAGVRLSRRDWAMIGAGAAAGLAAGLAAGRL